MEVVMTWLSVSTMALVATFIIAISTWTRASTCLDNEMKTAQVCQSDWTQEHFRAAVYENVPTVPPRPWIRPSRKQALIIMNANLRAYERQAKRAYIQGADILVFPEDGLYGPGPFTRDSIEPYLEYIPDPKHVTWNPCVEPNRFPNTEVQRTLSCMARCYHLYLVANIGDRQPCLHTLSHTGHNQQGVHMCPPDGRFQYNTNVGYSPNGTLLARYHKYNLFAEHHFNVPATPEYIFFDTPFGRIGTVTCFDILFAEPFVNLIERFSIDTLVFPAGWMDNLPIWPAIQYHSGVAIQMSINILSSNIHWPNTSFVGGSGVFLHNGNISFYRDPLSPTGQLVVALVPSFAIKIKSQLPGKDHLSPRQHPVLPIGHALSKRAVDKTFGNLSQEEFHARINSNNFTLIWLERNMTQGAVCQGNVCCAVTYEFSNTTVGQQGAGQSTERYALGAFDGIHVFAGVDDAYLQVCIVVKCAGDTPASCSQFVTTAYSKFDSMTLIAHFNTSYVSPEVVVSRNNDIAPAPSGSWWYDKTTMTLASDDGFTFPLLAVTLFGRWYDMD